MNNDFANELGSSIARRMNEQAAAMEEMLLNDPKANPAKWVYERLVEYIRKFEENLDEAHEIGARLVSFGNTVTFHINGIGYHNPSIITFYGSNENGEGMQLIQNVTQLSVLLVALKKREDKPKRIGFKLKHEMETQD